MTRVDALLRRTTRFRGSVSSRATPGAPSGSSASTRCSARGRRSPPPPSRPTAPTWPAGSADVLGVLRVRAVVQNPGQATAASASPEVGVTVYRQALATWYGPGFYGRAHRLRRPDDPSAPRRRPQDAGVRDAGRRLLQGPRAITVPVVDRGPFARGVRYDLTFATAQALGFVVTDSVGALPIAPPAPPAA